MKVLLVSLFLHATLPGYLAQEDTPALDDTQTSDAPLTGPNWVPSLGRELYPVEQDQGSQGYVFNNAGRAVFMVLDGKKCLGLVGTSRDDAKAVDSDDLKEKCNESNVSDIEILQKDGTTRKVGGAVRNFGRKLTGNELGQTPDVSPVPLTRRAPKLRGDYAALKRRSPRQFANHAALRRRDAEAQLAVHQQLQRRAPISRGNPSATSSPSSSDESTSPPPAP
ncbi:hypothetical protein H4R35_003711 [Dimargaris xerosporica]|nr:hypothetical protein H4R35_003711 [Dimargaris xerosporica]